MPKHKIIIIGSGFAGLSAASILAKDGYDVTVLEKNDQLGGRARVWEKDGFRFDMGPSWYWMPEVFENYFKIFNKKSSDFYHLKRLDPSYRVHFGMSDYVDLAASHEKLSHLFEQLEPGGSASLDAFLKDAKEKYETAMTDYVFRPSHSMIEYCNVQLLIQSLKMDLLRSVRKHIRKYFREPRLLKVLEFPVLFLGGTPSNTPALYTLMNYADMSLGTWYPNKGMNEIVKAMESIAVDQGVTFHCNTEVKRIISRHGSVTGIETDRGMFDASVVIANADYRHTDQQLLQKEDRNYSSEYWESRILSPSSLLFYIGVNKKLSNLVHHNLFFDEDLEIHADEIYKNPKWPTKPLFYVSCPSQTDDTVAPPGCENLFFLMPLAPGLADSDELREQYYEVILSRFEEITGNSIRESVILKRSYAMTDFIKDYHSFKGNAYGLANTLWQTAFLKPKLRSKKLRNLFFTGQLTVPGPGVPPALISGQIVAKEVHRFLNSRK